MNEQTKRGIAVCLRFAIPLVVFIFFVAVPVILGQQIEPLSGNFLEGGLIKGEGINKYHTFFSNQPYFTVELELTGRDQPTQLLIEIATASGRVLLKWQAGSNESIGKARQVRNVVASSPEQLVLRLFCLRSNPEGSYKIWLKGIDAKRAANPTDSNAVKVNRVNESTPTGQSGKGRGAELISVKFSDRLSRETLYMGSYALIIGESKYANGWRSLPGVADDVSAIRSALSEQFDVETALDLNKSDLLKKLNDFVEKYGYTDENRLLIYFAGHGYSEKIGDDREVGYIVPVDAPLPDKNITGFRQKAISVDTIISFAKQIQSKHALFVFDSCFSGKFLSRDSGVLPDRIVAEMQSPVRQFITSGGAKEVVPDYSIFRRYFIKGIADGKADRNNDGYVLASELGDYLRDKVIGESNRAQNPQYGKIFDGDLNKGDFVFVVTGKLPPIR